MPSDSSPLSLPTFQALPAGEVARLVQEAGTEVCVFPINGTRRWFLLEHRAEARGPGGFTQAYFRAAGRKHVELYRLMFDHGLTTLLTPVFGPELLRRGSEYERMVVPGGLLWLAENPEFLRFYDEYDVRVRVYGDARRYFGGPEHAQVLEAFDRLAVRTASHQRFRLFLGVCAHAPAETVAAIGARHQQEHGSLPDYRQIVEAYYGEYVPPVDLFIGFEPPAAFDMPLIATGEEDLYFTVSPSPYLERATLRAILYDHLYSRREDEDYRRMTERDWQAMGEFYRLNRTSVLGLGRRHRAGFWHPIPQVELPPTLKNDTI
jgi:tuberculosinol/isotuberculosinol synthase